MKHGYIAGLMVVNVVAGWFGVSCGNDKAGEDALSATLLSFLIFGALALLDVGSLVWWLVKG